MTEIGIGIVGGGYMGKAHSSAFASVGTVFETTLKPRLEAICASTLESGARYARAYGYNRAATDWRDLVNDPKVEAVVIASPQSTHREVAVAACAAAVSVKALNKVDLPTFGRPTMPQANPIKSFLTQIWPQRPRCGEIGGASRARPQP